MEVEVCGEECSGMRSRSRPREEVLQPAASPRSLSSALTLLQCQFSLPSRGLGRWRKLLIHWPWSAELNLNPACHHLLHYPHSPFWVHFLPVPTQRTDKALETMTEEKPHDLWGFWVEPVPYHSRGHRLPHSCSSAMLFPCSPSTPDRHQFPR